MTPRLLSQRQRNLTEIAYPGAVQTSGFGINDAGEITGSYINSSGHSYGFTYSKGTYASTAFAQTFGVNSKGTYVGYYWGVPDATPSGYLASPQTFKLSTVKVPGNQQAQLSGVNNSGVSVGSYVASDGKPHGMMISAGKIKNIDDPKGVSTACSGINTSGQIVGFYTDTSGNPHGFEYTTGKFKYITGPSGALLSAAFGINDSGTIVGLYVDGTYALHGFMLTGTKYKVLNVKGSHGTIAVGINNAGLVTVDSKMLPATRSPGSTTGRSTPRLTFRESR